MESTLFTELTVSESASVSGGLFNGSLFSSQKESSAIANISPTVNIATIPQTAVGVNAFTFGKPTNAIAQSASIQQQGTNIQPTQNQL